MGVLRIVFVLLRALFGSRSALAADNMALRQPLAVLCRSVKRPKLRPLISSLCPPSLFACGTVSLCYVTTGAE